MNAGECMSEQEALTLAIAALQLDNSRLAAIARDWLQYGDALQFNKAESKQAAETIERNKQAIKVLEHMLQNVKAA
jgi:hypothetical protein